MAHVRINGVAGVVAESLRNVAQEKYRGAGASSRGFVQRIGKKTFFFFVGGATQVRGKRNGNKCPNSEMRDGRNCVRTSGWDGNIWANSGTGNSRDGSKIPYGWMLDGGNRNQRRDKSELAVRNEISHGFPYRFRPNHIFMSHPDLYRAYPCYFMGTSFRIPGIEYRTHFSFDIHHY